MQGNWEPPTGPTMMVPPTGITHPSCAIPPNMVCDDTCTLPMVKPIRIFQFVSSKKEWYQKYILPKYIPEF